MIRRIAALSVLSIVALAPAAYSAPKEQLDGCDHGASSKPCRPDPQPDRGKDCDLHGRHGGQNEDHCFPAPEVSSSTTTTTTTSPAPTTTTAPAPLTTATTATTAPPASTGTAPPSAVSTPETGLTQTAASSTTATVPSSSTRTELPATGVASGLLLTLGVALLSFGVCILAIRWALR